jgi:hypothetical protein
MAESGGNGDPSRACADVLADEMSFPSNVTRKPKPGGRLGEELPVFCERCGYSLHGLPQVRCTSCDVLHFACPECNHHQPINTLRPAFQRMLGRLRAIGLAAVVLLKILFFFWILFFWGVGGTEIAYSYNYRPNPVGGGGSGQYAPARLEAIGCVILFMFGMAFAAVGRMLLLRWRRGFLIGLTLGALVAGCLLAGAYFRMVDSSRELPSPIAPGFLCYIASAFAGALMGASVAWGVWLALTYAFLPKRTAAALIEWQRAMSAPAGAPDRTDATTSVTA